jgi:hypothetical protein
MYANMINAAPRDLVESFAGTQARSAFECQFQRERTRATLRRLWAFVTGRSNRLLDLAQLSEETTLSNQYDAGIKTVPIDRIQASAGRTRDFDRQFYPLTSRSKERWISIATARQKGLALPPVELIQIGDIYAVRDGHHRISVARMIGETFVEAKVTVWE